MQSLISSSFIAVATLFAMTFCEITHADTTLCNEQEEAYFSCKTHSGKIISLCTTKKSESLIYKFGTTKRIELAFQSNTGDNSKFLFNHYIRNSVDYLTISFILNNYRYSIFRNYDEEIDKFPDYGVTVEDGLRPDRETTISCAAVNVDRLPEAARRLQCDPESALGCADLLPSRRHSPARTMQ